MAEIAAVFQFQVEAGGIAQFLHRRRHEGEDLGVAAARRSACMARLAMADGAVLGALALVPVLQMDEGDAGILAGAGED